MIGPARARGRAGKLCHHAPQYDPECFVHYGDEAAPHERPGVYYCFVCDTVERDYCAGCFLVEHDEHWSEARARESFDAGERYLLRGPEGRVWAARNEVAERVRPLDYLDALEPYGWDETRAPVWLTPDYCARREGLRRQVAALKALLACVAVDSAEMTRRLGRIAREPRKAQAWAERLGAALLVGRTLPRDRTRWEVPCSTRCDHCGSLRAPYGPAPRECTPCLIQRLETAECGEAAE